MRKPWNAILFTALAADVSILSNALRAETPPTVAGDEVFTNSKWPAVAINGPGSELTYASFSRLPRGKFTPSACFESNIDYFGCDIQKVEDGRIRDPHACQQLCTQTAGCAYWTYLPGTSACYLKSENALQGRTRLPSAISGPRLCLPRNGSCYEIDTAYYGWDDQKFVDHVVVSPEECHRLCLAFPRCHFWTWVSSQRNCYLKTEDARGGSVHASGSISGPRHCTGVSPPQPKEFSDKEHNTQIGHEQDCYDHNVVYNGINIDGDTTAGGPRDCQRLCQQHPACRGFSFFPLKKKCMLKSTYWTWVPEANAISGPKFCYTPECSLEDVEYYGKILQAATTPSFATCHRQCPFLQLCSAVTFDNTSHLCSLIQSVEYTSIVVSGPKLCRASGRQSSGDAAVLGAAAVAYVDSFGDSFCYDSSVAYTSMSFASKLVDTPELCQAHCRTQSRCKFFTYFLFGKKCLMHESEGQRVPNETAVCGPSVCPVRCFFEGIEIYGKDVGSCTTEDAAGCQKVCQRNRRCSFFVYDKISNLCLQRQHRGPARGVTSAPVHCVVPDDDITSRLVERKNSQIESFERDRWHSFQRAGDALPNGGHLETTGKTQKRDVDVADERSTERGGARVSRDDLIVTYLGENDGPPLDIDMFGAFPGGSEKSASLAADPSDEHQGGGSVTVQKDDVVESGIDLSEDVTPPARNRDSPNINLEENKRPVPFSVDMSERNSHGNEGPATLHVGPSDEGQVDSSVTVQIPDLMVSGAHLGKNVSSPARSRLSGDAFFENNKPPGPADVDASVTTRYGKGVPVSVSPSADRSDNGQRDYSVTAQEHGAVEYDIDLGENVSPRGRGRYSRDTHLEESKWPASPAADVSEMTPGGDGGAGSLEVGPSDESQGDSLVAATEHDAVESGIDLGENVSPGTRGRDFRDTHLEESKLLASLDADGSEGIPNGNEGPATFDVSPSDAGHGDGSVAATEHAVVESDIHLGENVSPRARGRYSRDTYLEESNWPASPEADVPDIADGNEGPATLDVGPSGEGHGDGSVAATEHAAADSNIHLGENVNPSARSRYSRDIYLQENRGPASAEADVSEMTPGGNGGPGALDVDQPDEGQKGSSVAAPEQGAAKPDTNMHKGVCRRAPDGAIPDTNLQGNVGPASLDVHFSSIVLHGNKKAAPFDEDKSEMNAERSGRPPQPRDSKMAAEDDYHLLESNCFTIGSYNDSLAVEDTIARSTEACQTKCRNEELCSFFSFFRGSGRCTLHLTTGNKMLKLEAVSGPWKCGATPRSGNCLVLGEYLGKALNGEGHASTGVTECYLLCVAHQSCKVFTYDGSRFMCKLFESVHALKNAVTSVSGPRNCATAEANPCFQDGVRCEGGETVARVVTSAHGCLNACQEDASCSFYSYDKVTQNCSLIADSRKDTRDDSAMCGAKNCFSPSFDPSCFYVDTIYASESRKVQARSFPECYNLCEKDRTCRFFSYIGDERKCQLHELGTIVAERHGAIAGARHCTVSYHAERCLMKSSSYVGEIAGTLEQIETSLDCQMQCAANAECRFFTYAADAETCILFRSRTRLLPDIQTTSGWKTCPSAEACASVEQIDAEKYALFSFYAKDFDTCNAYCLQIDECSLAEYDPSTKKCHLAPLFEVMPGVLSGPLFCSVNTSIMWTSLWGGQKPQEVFRSAGFCFQEDTRYAGAFVERVSADSAYSCQRMCQGHPDCSFFSYYWLYGECHLYGTDIASVVQSDFVSGPAWCSPLPVDCIIENLAVYGEVAIETNTSTPESCVASCKACSGCTYFMFDTLTGHCTCGFHPKPVTKRDAAFKACIRHKGVSELPMLEAVLQIPAAHVPYMRRGDKSPRRTSAAAEKKVVFYQRMANYSMKRED